MYLHHLLTKINLPFASVFICANASDSFQADSKCNLALTFAVQYIYNIFVFLRKSRKAVLKMKIFIKTIVNNLHLSGLKYKRLVTTKSLQTAREVFFYFSCLWFDEQQTFANNWVKNIKFVIRV